MELLKQKFLSNFKVLSATVALAAVFLSVVVKEMKEGGELSLNFGAIVLSIVGAAQLYVMAQLAYQLRMLSYNIWSCDEAAELSYQSLQWLELRADQFGSSASDVVRHMAQIIQTLSSKDYAESMLELSSLKERVMELSAGGSLSAISETWDILCLSAEIDAENESIYMAQRSRESNIGLNWLNNLAQIMTCRHWRSEASRSVVLSNETIEQFFENFPQQQKAMEVFRNKVYHRKTLLTSAVEPQLMNALRQLFVHNV